MNNLEWESAMIQRRFMTETVKLLGKIADTMERQTKALEDVSKSQFYLINKISEKVLYKEK